MKNNFPMLNEEHTDAMMRGTWGRSQERDRKMLTFLLRTGLKVKEFINLNVEDVFSGKRMRKNLVINERIGKNQRKIPLDREAREAAAVILDFNRRQGFKLSMDEPLMVSRQRNKKDGSYRITPRQVQRIIKTLREEADLDFKTTPQTFRHTYAKGLIDSGMDLKSVQIMLGHRSIKTTRDLYGKMQAEL